MHTLDRQQNVDMSILWSAPRRVGPPPKLYNVFDLTAVGRDLVAGNNGGGVALLPPSPLPDGRRWDSIIADAEASPLLGPRVGMQHRFVGWDGRLCGLASSRAVFSLDQERRAWTALCPPDPKLKLSWALTAFDPARNLLVVWGARKADGKRQDATLVFDGQRWSKPKKSTPVGSLDLARDAGAFCLAFEPELGGVVRIATSEAAWFDGKAWHPLELEGAQALHDWERLPIHMSSTRQTFLVQRFMLNPSIVELVSSSRTLAVKPAAVLPPAVTRERNAVGSNAAFDVAGFDDARCLLVALDDQKHEVYELDLSSLRRTR